jgi:hypothetical protein
MVEPSGRRTVRGEFVGFLFVHGTFMPLKCPVDPVSAIAIWCGAGPRVLFAVLLFFVKLLQSLGVPRSYAMVGGVVVAVGWLRLRLLSFGN